ncbi:MAG TPA: SRPBCC family protein [Actinocrinis sp.]
MTLPTDTQILITREFDAPRRLVYRAWTEPELITRWFAGQRGKVTLAEVDLRVGGTWRYVMQANNGFEVAFHGEFREIVPDERLVSTQIYEALPHVQATTVTEFAEKDGRTTVSLLVEHTSRENRDGHLDSGMEEGMNESFDLLERVARELAG